MPIRRKAGVLAWQKAASGGSMTENEIYYPMVYCKNCAFYHNYGPGSDKCCERHAVADAPIFPPSDIPLVRNANHDCRDYEEKI